MNPLLAIRNPMCSVFPTVTSCTIPNVGASGVAQFHNGLCVLTQNIINEKIYLVLWFWYAFLGPLSVLFVFYRLFTIFFGGIRFSLIYRTVRRKYDDDICKSLDYVLAKSQIGDWFVLYQLSKNCNPYFYREFIRELARELKYRPKKTRSKGKANGSGTIKRKKNLSRTSSKEEELLVGDGEKSDLV